MERKDVFTFGAVLLFIGLLGYQWASGFTTGCIGGIVAEYPTITFPEVSTICSTSALAYWIPMNMSLILGIAFVSTAVLGSIDDFIIKFRKKK